MLPNRTRWRRWINRISEEMTFSAVERHMFERWRSIVDANDAIDFNHPFVALLWSSYFNRQVMTIRRQLKVDSRAISLVALMKDIAKHNKLITREEFLKEYAGPRIEEKLDRDARRARVKLFDSFAGRGRPHISRERVNKDIERLRPSSRTVEYYSDKWLAHSDRRRRWPRLRFDDLNKTLDLLYGTWERYHYVAWNGPIDMDPAWLAGTEWEQVLTIPWKASP